MHKLPPLPYSYDALSPFISAETLHFHYDKHHQTYVDNLNKLIQGKPQESQNLEDIIMSSHTTEKGIFNNAAQVWNHSFYWNSMKPQGGGNPTGGLAQAIESDFGSFDKMKDLFKQAAVSQFGSGWAWLVVNEDQKLEILQTGNAELPLTLGKKALVTCDVWEHAYYIDYRNVRAEYVGKFLDQLVNWDFAAQNYSS